MKRKPANILKAINTYDATWYKGISEFVIGLAN
jgi:hypothetical protein